MPETQVQLRFSKFPRATRRGKGRRAPLSSLRETRPCCRRDRRTRGAFSLHSRHVPSATCWKRESTRELNWASRHVLVALHRRLCSTSNWNVKTGGFRRKKESHLQECGLKKGSLLAPPHGFLSPSSSPFRPGKQLTNCLPGRVTKHFGKPCWKNSKQWTSPVYHHATVNSFKVIVLKEIIHSEKNHFGEYFLRLTLQVGFMSFAKELQTCIQADF